MRFVLLYSRSARWCTLLAFLYRAICVSVLRKCWRVVLEKWIAWCAQSMNCQEGGDGSPQESKNEIMLPFYQNLYLQAIYYQCCKNGHCAKLQCDPIMQKNLPRQFPTASANAVAGKTISSSRQLRVPCSWWDLLFMYATLQDTEDHGNWEPGVFVGAGLLITNQSTNVYPRNGPDGGVVFDGRAWIA